MAFVWPASLPSNYRADDWEQSQAANPNVSTPMNYGVMRQRPTSSVRVIEQNVQLVMSAAQLDAFDAFHRQLQDGSSSFMMPVWTGSGYKTLLTAIKDGVYKKNYFSPGFTLVTMTIRALDP